MKFLNVDELARVVVFREIVEEATDTFVEFESLALREADKLLRDVPLEADECRDECEMVVPFSSCQGTPKDSIRRSISARS